jgi:peptidoglycan/LPS O-acetylase OafA/YrhL
LIQSLKKSTHLPALDGVRGLAILLVLWHHCYMQPSTGALGFLYQLNRAAWVGVDLFFVLSGFLITGILFDSLQREDYFRRFYKRRALRIFPLYYGVVLLLLVLSLPLGLHWQGRQWLLLGYLQNVGIMQPFQFDISNWVTLNHFWSLSIEEQYYLVWPLVIYLVRDKIKLVWISIALSLLALGLRFYAANHINAAYVFIGTPFRMDALLIGSALALISRSYWRWAVRRYALYAFGTGFVITAALGVWARGFDWWSHPVETYGFTLSAFLCAALIAMSLREGSWTEKLFQNSVLRFFGRYSYGLYVWHAFVYAGLRTRLARPLGAGLADLACIALSVGIALVSYHGFEKWFLQMKDKAAGKMVSPRKELVIAN